MKRVYIALSRLMNNWDIIPQGTIIGDNQVFFHRDAQLASIDGECMFNFDYLIDNGTASFDNIDLCHIFPKSRSIIIPRYDKFVQSAMINLFYSENKNKLKGLSTFEKIETWYSPQKSGASTIANPRKKFIVKPLQGARGIGQFLIDPSKIPFLKFIEILDLLRSDKISSAEFVEKLTKYDPSFRIDSGKENHTSEGIDCINNQGFVIQSYVPHVEHEYRIITDCNSDIAYVQKRTIDAIGKPFPQATGSDSNSIEGKDITSIDKILSSGEVKALRELIKSVVGPMSSLDLFTTHDGKWGIFEFCNQFGIVGVPYEITYKLHYDAINKLISNNEA